MASLDPRVDAYIAQSAPFAQPLLTQIRAVVHAACPEVVETIKWGMPSFTHGGKILAHMAAFKQHCTLGFWQGRQLLDSEKTSEAMGQFGRLTTLADLPTKRELTQLVKRAKALIDDGVKPLRSTRTTPRPPPEVPVDLAAELVRNAAAAQHFKAFSPSAQREYIEWIGEAKRADTRSRRLAQAIEWLSEGKARNWKYENC
nr:YdeI/OmpD-associated family protein [uncultured Roseateles sp.]